jgi:hypothetical protein
MTSAPCGANGLYLSGHDVLSITAEKYAPEYHQRIAEVLERIPGDRGGTSGVWRHYSGAYAKAVAYWQQAARRLRSVQHTLKRSSISTSGLTVRPETRSVCGKAGLQTMLGPA